MKIGDNASSINSASLLELETTSKGFVPPRVSLTSVASTSPLPAGLLNGTIVYNTNSSITGGNGTGLYIWNISSSAWIPVTPNYGSGTSDYVARWTGSSILGTGLIRDNNTGVGINTAPVSTEMLTVSGGSSLNGINSTTTRSTSGSYSLRGNSVSNVTGYIGYVGSVTVASTTATNPAGYFAVTSSSAPPVLGTTSSSATSAAVVGLSGVWHGGYFATAVSSAKGIVGINTTSGAYLLGGGDGVYGETGQRYAYGVYGVNSNNNGSAIFAENNASNGSNGGNGVEASTGQNGGFAVFAYNGNSTGTAVFGAGNNATGTYLSSGSGGAFTGNSTGTFSLAKTSASGNGLISLGNNGSTITTLSGGSGGTLIGASTGVFGLATTSASGTGVVGAGNSSATVSTLAGGSGGAFTGATAGVYGYASTASNGTGVIGVGNNGAVQTDANGSGGAFSGSTDAVYAYATSTSQGAAAIKTYNAATAGNVYVNYLSDGALGSAGTSYKIIGTGTVSTIVKDINNKTVALHAPEAPEIYFEDYGEGLLINGKAHINIDPVFTKNILVNEKHPLRVFVQLYGDCKGVFVSNTSANGFDVTELQGGTSNTPFQWHIVCNRADEYLPNGQVSKNADIRFEQVNFPANETERNALPQLQAKTENVQTTEAIVIPEKMKQKNKRKNKTPGMTAPGKTNETEQQ